MGELWHTRLEKLRNYWEFLLKLSRLAYFDMRPVVIRSQDIPQGKGDWNRIRELLEQIELLLFDKNVHKLELAVHELFIKMCIRYRKEMFDDVELNIDAGFNQEWVEDAHFSPTRDGYKRQAADRQIPVARYSCLR